MKFQELRVEKNTTKIAKFENPKHEAPRETNFMKGSVVTFAEDFDPEARFGFKICQILIFREFCRRTFWRIFGLKKRSLGV